LATKCAKMHVGDKIAAFPAGGTPESSQVTTRVEGKRKGRESGKAKGR